VWELAPFAHERSAWVRHMLVPAAAPLNAYLGDVMQDGPVGGPVGQGPPIDLASDRGPWAGSSAVRTPTPFKKRRRIAVDKICHTANELSQGLVRCVVCACRQA